MRIQALWRARVLKHNLSAFVRIGKRTRAIRIQRTVRVVLAQRELHKRKEAFKVRSAALSGRYQTNCTGLFPFVCGRGCVLQHESERLKRVHTIHP